ncbi:hypothetical protein ACFV08_18240 [Streptomyces fradiae]|uniref:Secreted protein n=2 Tax=Streptomyces TaxID=1883 RepID=A0A1D8G5S2_9ACTN|nr:MULTISPECIES: hypothetical protein [Streptomyces]AOT60800.1 hypothetical protein A4G23_03675 [Streptomyces rubrolavendulae]UQS30883.1 hypothetical protein J5J01_03915 [Streptomyces fradiae]
MVRRRAAIPRRAVEGAAAVALALLLTACGGDAGGDSAGEQAPGKAGSASSAPTPQDPPKDGGGGPDTSRTLATLTGAGGLELVIHTAARDQGGFLTVTGTLKNPTSQTLEAPLEWNGEELQVKKTGPSFAGATLIDKVDKKRYYVLRDTEGFPLTTTGVTTVKGGESIVMFAQFPAPPVTTTQVEFQLPKMSPATIEIS